jgi:HAD superfamily hydrolase (TIGR01509 family)
VRDVRNVIFDLGGVVLDWNPDPLVARFQPDAALRAEFKEAVFGHEDWLQYDRGTLTESDMIGRMEMRTGRSRDELLTIMDAVRESLVEKPETVDLLRSLQRRGTPLYCLSNMPSEIYAHLRRRHAFWDAFRGIVISSQVRLIKPQPEVFVHLLDQFGLRAQESVFVDDVAANVDAASRVGLKTIWFRDAEQCRRELEQMLAA